MISISIWLFDSTSPVEKAMWLESWFKTSFPRFLPFSGDLQSFVSRLEDKEGVVSVIKVIIFTDKARSDH